MQLAHCIASHCKCCLLHIQVFTLTHVCMHTAILAGVSVLS